MYFQNFSRTSFSHATRHAHVSRAFVAITAIIAFIVFTAFAQPSRAGELISPTLATNKPNEATLWYDLRLLGVEGRGWSETLAPYDRLPAKSEKVVRGAVWGLSRNSAGLCARFVTDATALNARWALTSKNLALPHMPATGVSGVDLYVRDASGAWRWVSCGRPTDQTNSTQLISGMPAGTREFLLYLPLYNGVASVEIGLPKNARLEKAPAWGAGERKPIVFYGTSITQGGCASRPGMVHTAIIQRHLNYPVINLGFSGNGKMEPEVASLLAELDPSVFVIDCLPNMSGPEVAQRAENLVKTVRAARPNTPILLVEDRTFTNAHLVPSKMQHHKTSRAALRAAFDKLTAAGTKNLHYLTGDDLLGDDTEGTVDSSHPTDLGFLRQAEAFKKSLVPLLPK